MLPKKLQLRYQKKLEKVRSEWKPVSERQWAKSDERKWNLHPLVTMDTHSIHKEVSNKISYKI
jgi:hypothetical protein